MGLLQARRPRKGQEYPPEDDLIRRRIAHELRNSTLQITAALSMNLGVIKRGGCSWSPDERRVLNECLDLTKQCEQELEILARLLYPPLLDEFGLCFALPRYVDAFEKRNECDVKLKIGRVLSQQRLPLLIEIALFRAVQEVLANAETQLHKFVRIEAEMSGKGRSVRLHISSQREAARYKVPARAPRVLDPGFLEVKKRISELGGDSTFRSGAGFVQMVITLPAS